MDAIFALLGIFGLIIAVFIVSIKAYQISKRGEDYKPVDYMQRPKPKE